MDQAEPAAPVGVVDAGRNIAGADRKFHVGYHSNAPRTRETLVSMAT